jgi:hypothetical protein
MMQIFVPRWAVRATRRRGKTEVRCTPSFEGIGTMAGGAQLKVPAGPKSHRKASLLGESYWHIHMTGHTTDDDRVCMIGDVL